MHFAEVQPTPALRAHVRRFWWLSDASRLAGRPPERIVPDGRMEIIVHLGPPFTREEGPRAGRQPRAILAGQLRAPLLLRPGPTIELFAIRLHPWGARSLLGVDPTGLLDRLPPLDEVVGADADRLGEALAAAPSGAARVAAAERWCLARLSRARLPPLPVVQAVRAALAGDGAVGVGGLARHVGWGPRRLERAFREHVGLAPRPLLSIGRVQRVLAELRRTPWSPLAGLAPAHGFVDQAHLTREFRRWVGTTPGQYRAEAHRLEDWIVEGEA